MKNINKSFPHIICKINDINAEFCLETKPYIYENSQILNCKDYQDLANLVEKYLSIIKSENEISSAVFITPDTIHDGVISVLNIPWPNFSIKESSESLSKIGISNVIFISHHHALSLSTPLISSSELISFNKYNSINTKRPKITLIPGDKLNIAILAYHPKTCEYITTHSEGANCSYGPTSEEEELIFEYAMTKHDHISAETFISSSGIKLIYEALCYINNIKFNNSIDYEKIIENATCNNDYISTKTLEIFCEIFGSFTGNLAVMTNAFGGIYIGGNIITKMIDYFIKSGFSEKLQAKGRYQTFLDQIPIFIMTSKNQSSLGASYALDVYLNQDYIP